MDIDNDLLAFLEAQKGARKLSVIGGGRNDAIRRQFHEPVTDPDRVICCSLRRYRCATGTLSLDPFGEGCRKRSERASLQEQPPINCHEEAPSRRPIDRYKITLSKYDSLVTMRDHPGFQVNSRCVQRDIGRLWNHAIKWQVAHAAGISAYLQ